MASKVNRWRVLLRNLFASKQTWVSILVADLINIIDNYLEIKLTGFWHADAAIHILKMDWPAELKMAACTPLIMSKRMDNSFAIARAVGKCGDKQLVDWFTCLPPGMDMDVICELKYGLAYVGRLGLCPIEMPIDYCYVIAGLVHYGDYDLFMTHWSSTIYTVKLQSLFENVVKVSAQTDVRIIPLIMNSAAIKPRRLIQTAVKCNNIAVLDYLFRRNDHSSSVIMVEYMAEYDKMDLLNWYVSVETIANRMAKVCESIIQRKSATTLRILRGSSLFNASVLAFDAVVHRTVECLAVICEIHDLRGLEYHLLENCRRQYDERVFAYIFQEIAGYAAGLVLRGDEQQILTDVLRSCNHIGDNLKNYCLSLCSLLTSNGNYAAMFEMDRLGIVFDRDCLQNALGNEALMKLIVANLLRNGVTFACNMFNHIDKYRELAILARPIADDLIAAAEVEMRQILFDG